MSDTTILPNKGDTVTFRSYTRPGEKLRGIVTKVDNYYPWRGRYTEVVYIQDDDGWGYCINAERVSKV